MRNRAIVNLSLFVAFAVASLPQATGVAWHEWISLVVLIPLALHLLSDWDWIVRTGKGVLGRLAARTRFNFVWDLLLFLNMVVVIGSGMMISEAALPAVGLSISHDNFWLVIHDFTANLMLALLGVHLALHWSWIRTAFGRLIGRRASNASVDASENGGASGANGVPTALRNGFRLALVGAIAAVLFASFTALQNTAWADALRNQPEESDMESLSQPMRVLLVSAKQSLTLLGPAVIAWCIVHFLSRGKRAPAE